VGGVADEPMLRALSPDQWGDEEYDAFGALLGIPGDRVPRAGSGHRFDPLNFAVIGVLANHPSLTKAFLGYNAYLMQSSSLPGRLREFAILAVAQRARAAYLWAEHVDIARGVGITDDEIESLATGGRDIGGEDLLVLEATDELHDRGSLSPEVWTGLCDELGLRPAMDLVFVVGTYRMLASAFTTWGLEPAADAARLPEA
jgi:4-carboxymuconolactone decarboxylase